MYYEYSLNLAEQQKKKIVIAYKNKTSVKIRLSNSSLHSNSNVTFRLTSQQISRIKKPKHLDMVLKSSLVRPNYKNKPGF